MTRLLRSVVVLAFLLGIGSVVAGASTAGTPSVSGLDQPAVPASGLVTIRGQRFSSGAGDCTLAGRQTRVHLYLSSGTVQEAPLDGSPTDPSVCNDSMVRARVPTAFTGSARVTVTDPQGNESNRSGSGFVPQLTARPSASVNPSSGQVGTITALQGSGLKPPSVAPGSNIAISVGGGGVTARTWSDNRIDFDPANQSGVVAITMTLSIDANNAANTTPADFSFDSYRFMAPTVQTTQVEHQVVGSRFNIDGQNLGTTPGSVIFTGNVAAQGLSWSPSGIGVTVPPGAQPGPTSVNLPGFQLNGPSVGIDPSVQSLVPGAASAGQAVRASGYNFGRSRGSVQVGGAGAAVTSWSDGAVVFNVGADNDGGAVTITRPDGVAVAAGNLAVVPHLSRVENDGVAPGSQVVVDGTSLGAATGHATIGTVDAASLLWSRTSVLLQVPADLPPGVYPVTVTSAAGVNSNPLELRITAAPASAGATNQGRPGSTPAAGAPAGVGGALAPSFDNNHDFVKPIKPPSPVYFNITAYPHKVRAGGTASIVVTLKLNDKPLSGAQVKLSMLFTPGSDYRFAPESGVTDANGEFRATVTVSKNVGDSVIAAVSGVFSDQDHVAGTGADGKVVSNAQANPAAQNGGFMPLAFLGVVAVLLVAGGFYLNIRSIA